MSSVALTEAEVQHLNDVTGLLSTIDPDGYPHTVPITIQVDGNSLICNTGEATRKILNIQRDAKVSLCAFGDPKWCVLVQGLAALEPVENGRVIIRVTPVRKISWPNE